VLLRWQEFATRSVAVFFVTYHCSAGSGVKARVVNNYNNNNQDDNYGAVIMAKPLREFTRFIRWMQIQHWGGRQPSDQAIRLGLGVSQKEMAASVHIHRHHFIITQPESWYSFYRPTKGGRLSRPRHCSKGVNPCPRLYVSVAVTIRPLRHLLIENRWM